MNAKYFVLVALAIVFVACKRNHVSIDREVRKIQHSSDYAVSVGPAASGEGSYRETEAIQSETIDKEDRLNKPEVLWEKNLISDSVTTKDTSRKELKKKIKAEQKANKEMDPRLSRGLLMTIFGGIATTLGIVFMAYAPTGLFVFAFGIVFLVGLVTLIMYWANPKPKM